MSNDVSESCCRVAVLVSAIISLLTAPAYSQPPKKDEPAIVVCAHVVATSQTNQQTFLGSVEPIRRSIVGSAVDGRVMKVLFDVGNPVGSESNNSGEFLGQPLIQLRTQSLEIELATARLQIIKREQELEELTTSIPRDIELASATLAGAKAREAYARNNFERLQKMSGNRGAVSATELEQARSVFTAGVEAVNGAAADLSKFESTKTIRLQQAENLLATAKQEIARLEDLKVKYTIRAPFQGFITQKSTEVGSWVSRGDSLFEVIQLDPIEFVVRVPQKFVGQIERSLVNADTEMKTELTFDSLDEKLTGTVQRVVPQADLKTRSFPVRIRIENPQLGDSHLLKPGMLGRARFGIGEPVRMLMVKKDALVLGGITPRVFKIVERDGQEIAISLDVETGASIGNWIQIKGDLQEDDVVVVEGNERLRPNQPVQVIDILKENIK